MWCGGGVDGGVVANVNSKGSRLPSIHTRVTVLKVTNGNPLSGSVNGSSFLALCTLEAECRTSEGV